MAGHEYLTSQNLFALTPPDGESLGLLHDYLYVTEAPFLALIHNTYFEIVQGDLSNVAELLAVWEMRLLLLLFTDQLAVAKREAVGLNNALYSHENPNYGPTNSTQANQNAPGVMPLPNNNGGQISDSLLALLLSLKAAPKLARVHELYRLCYQRRLKGPAKVEDSVFFNGLQGGFQAQLMALAYAVMAVLLVSRNYSTLVSFVDSMRKDIHQAIKRAKKNEGNIPDNFLLSYYSNVTFIWVVAKIHVRRGISPSIGAEMWGSVYDAEFGEVCDSTWTEFTYVAGKIAPQLTGELAPESVQGIDSVAALAHAMEKDHVSVRTLCCLLGFWSISATHGAVLSHKNNYDYTFTLPLSVDSSDATALSSAYNYVQGQWTAHFNKLYGLE